MTDFKDIKVSNFSAQLRKNRFPDPDGSYSNSNAQSILHFANETNNGDATAETYRGPPHIAKWRMNLSALSQKHNLYLVASRDVLHIYVPRDLKQKLPRIPDMIIQLPRSEEGVRVGGYIDPLHPHSINHMKVGNLGDLEIILMACDDGDIIAFYTHQIRNELAKFDVMTRIRDVRPCFHQNVGISAWGLAIHQKSRIIAVTSNRKHITIFVNSYSDTSKEVMLNDEDVDVSADDRKFPMMDTFEPLPTSFRDQDRRHNYRIVLTFGDHGANMPSIDFISGAEGEAEEIITTDINGTAWLLHIWNRLCCSIPGIYQAPIEDTFNHMSWGILALSPADFKLTSSIHEAQGFESHADVLKLVSYKPFDPFQGHFLNATPTNRRSMRIAMYGNPKPEPKIQSLEDENTFVSSPNSVGVSKLPVLVPKKGPRKHTFIVPKTEVSKTISEEAQHDTALLWLLLRLPKRMREQIQSWQSLVHRYNQLTRLDRRGIVPVFLDTDKPRPILESCHIFLRTYAYDIELLSHGLDETTVDTRMLNPLQENDNNGRGIFRLNMLALISELNIVIVASQSGNVCLLTLTRLNDPNGILPPFLSMRLDRRLPFLSQKRDFQPRCPLLGIAVSPLQKSTSSSHIKGVARRWRLILHYYDHTVLSYELGREGDDVLVF